MADHPTHWTANQSSGAIFDGEGQIIGVADPTSAAAIVSMHNRELGGVISVTPRQYDEWVARNRGR